MERRGPEMSVVPLLSPPAVARSMTLRVNVACLPAAAFRGRCLLSETLTVTWASSGDCSPVSQSQSRGRRLRRGVAVPKAHYRTRGGEDEEQYA